MRSKRGSGFSLFLKSFAIEIFIVIGAVALFFIATKPGPVLSEIVLDEPIVIDYMDKYPHASVVEGRQSIEMVSEKINVIRDDCGDSDLAVKEYYRVRVEQNEALTYLEFWIDMSKHTIECVVEKGKECESTAIRDCDTGNFGICALGRQRCVRGEWAECQARYSPLPEVCYNELDDDCDGVVNEGCR